MSSFPTPSPDAKPLLSDVTAIIVMAPAERGEQIVDHEETLRSVLDQEFPPRLVLLVETSLDAAFESQKVRDVSSKMQVVQRPPASGGDGVDTPAPRVLRVVATGAQRFGSAVTEALDAVPEALQSKWLWLLHDDMAARRDALREMLDVGSSSKTIGAVGPKQVRYGHPEHLLELGIDATSSGRRVFVIEPDEIDQGQHDQRMEVLAVGTAGMLVRSQVWTQVEGIDPALGAFGGGLEFGRRIWRSGNRVVVAPSAVVEHAQISYRHDTEGRASFGARRAAQLYNWALGLPQWQLWLFMLWVPLLSLARGFARLFTRHPGLAFGEWGAYFRFLGSLPALWRGRRRLRRVSRVPRQSLVPLEATGAQISRARRTHRKIRSRGSDTVVAIDQAAANALHRHRLHALAGFFTLLVVSALISAFVWFPYRGGLQGGLWGGLPTDWTVLMAQAWSGWQLSGDGMPGPASPLLLPLSIFSAPFALVGIKPLILATFLAYAALPLAASLGWALASSFTRSTLVRMASGALWATSGGLLLALMRADLGTLVVVLALPVVVIGLVRGLRPPVRFVAHGVEDLVAVAPQNTVAWIGVAGLASAAVVPAAPVTVVILPLLAALLGLEKREWRHAEQVLDACPPGRTTRVAAVLAVFLPGLVLILPTLAAQIARGTATQFWAWLAAPTLGFGDVWVMAGIPATVPLSSWGTSLSEAAASGVVQPWLLVAGATSGVALALWALACAVVATATAKDGFTLTLGAWLTAVVLLAFALVQMSVLPGLGTASSALFLSSGAALVVTVASSYSSYSLTVATLVKVPDRRGRWLRGLPSATAIVASLAAAGLLILGPLGVLAGRTGPANAQNSLAANPLLQIQADAQGEDEDVPARGPVFPPAISTFAEPAPTPSVPVIAQEAQAGPRAARLLAVGLTSGTVDAYLLRGADIQQADLNVAPLATSEDLQAADLARDELMRAAAVLTARPSPEVAETLANHSIDLVMLSSQSEDFLAVQAILDATAGLERIGNVEGSVLWRVRPGGRLPARASVIGTEDGSYDWVPSGAVRVDAQIEPDLSGTLVLSEVAASGWRASLNGEALEPVDDPLGAGGWRQAFALPPGGGELQVSYTAPYLWWWWIASGVVLVVVALMAVPRRTGFRSLVPVPSVDTVPPSEPDDGEGEDTDDLDPDLRPDSPPSELPPPEGQGGAENDF